MTLGELQLAPKRKAARGTAPEPPVRLSLDAERTERLVRLAKALADPVRLQLVDVLRHHAGEVCPCELVPLFGVSQPTLSHHFRALAKAGILGSTRRGLFVYYYVVPGALDDLAAWMGESATA
jgi:ArsR family transcriptional regulator, arsenate/arsenite/antimonite-responsive transcriptional repressor